MTTLYHYFSRLEDTLLSRQEIEIQEISIEQDKPDNDQGEFRANINFYDRSSLKAFERVSLEDGEIIKDDYSYHYQKSDNSLVFRYDNAPHHPEIETHPHHKHVGSDENVIAAQPPDLSDMLNEIDDNLYVQET